MNQPSKINPGRGRIVSYWLTGLILTLSLASLHGSIWRGSRDLHTHMEIIATLLAAIVGALALVRFYAKKNNTFLFIGTGFLGTALLDGYHAVVTSELILPLMPSDLPSLIPWSWLASRLFLSVMIFLGWYCWFRSQRVGAEGTISERTVYIYSGLFTLTCFLFFAFTPLPTGYFPDIAFHRPGEFGPALFFLAALIGYLKKGRWRDDSFEHWLILSLIIAVIGQTLFSSQSGQLFDYEFYIAHLLKNASYICVLIGLLFNMSLISRQAEEGEGLFRGAIESLQEGFAYYGPDDRLKIYNDEFVRLHSTVQDIIKPGLLFEDLVRITIQRGGIAKAVGREEEMLRERMEQHLNPLGPILRELTDGTWYIISEAKTPEGGIVVTHTDITELKDAERALREREALTRRILEASPVGVLIVTREGKHLFTNERALEIQGVTREQLFSANAGKYYADPELRITLKDNLYKTGSTPPTEVEFLKPDGTHYFVILSSTLTEFEGQKAHLTYMYDITDRKQSEREIEESQARLKAIIDTVPALINLKDRDGRYVMTNRYHSDFFKLEPDALIGKTSADLNKEHGERVAAKNHAVMEMGISISPYDYQMTDAQGHIRDLLTTKVPLKDLSGEVIGVVSTSIDITERKRAREALRQSEARTRTIVDNILDAIITINERGSIQSVNPATKAMFGYSDNELLGRNVSMLAAEPYRSAHDRYLANYLTTNDPKIIGIGREVEGQRKNGQRFPMELAVTEVVLDDERMFIGIIRDITQRREIDLLKSEFISTVSHELRTPLTSIRGSLGLITGGAIGKVSENARELIEMAEKNTKRLISLVNDILDIEKIESGSMEINFNPIDMVDLVKNETEANQGYADEYDIQFLLTDAEPGLMVRGDKDRLIQVLVNLLSNAAKFSPKGGRVEIAVTNVEGKARVSVTDNGPGIPDKFQGNIFEKFTQADSSDTRKVGGTGLGLNISKTIIEKHGGSIDFVNRNDPGNATGTTFYFELPLLPA